MKLIKQSFEILDRRGMNVCQKIEQCARIAYKSEDKISKDSAINFCTKLYDKHHFPVFEFANLHFAFDSNSMEEINFHLERFLQYTYNRKWVRLTACGLKDKYRFIVSGTLRAFLDAIDPNMSKEDSIFSEVAYSILTQIYNIPDIHIKRQEGQLPLEGDFFTGKSISPEMVKDNLGYTAKYHLMCAVKFITNRAVSHELVRHRPCSWIQESQRYCRYDQNKFGNEVAFIKPTAFFEEHSAANEVWEHAMADAEDKYFLLLNGGASPQAARIVLPNSCKTEIICFATIDQWNHIFKLRTSKEAEPSMRELMEPLKNVFYNEENIAMWE